MMNKLWYVYIAYWDEWELVKICSTESIARAWARRLNKTVSSEDRFGFEYKVQSMELTDEGPSPE